MSVPDVQAGGWRAWVDYTEAPRSSTENGPSVKVELYRFASGTIFRALLAGRFAESRQKFEIMFERSQPQFGRGEVVASRFSKRPLYGGLPVEYEDAVKKGASLVEDIGVEPLTGTLVIESAASHPVDSSAVAFELTAGLLAASLTRMARGTVPDKSWCDDMLLDLAVLTGAGGLRKRRSSAPS